MNEIDDTLEAIREVAQSAGWTVFKALAFGALFALVVLTAMLVPASARAQAVTDKPITKMPTLGSIASDVNLAAGRGCAAWWERDKDRFGDYHIAEAAFDMSLLGAPGMQTLQQAFNARDLGALTAARTHNMRDLTAARAPCMDDARSEQLRALLPPPAWTVAPIASGYRPAYMLKADGTRGSKSGDIPTTHGGKPAPCNCKVRSVETTSSTYCRPLSEPPGQQIVTLCRESK